MGSESALVKGFAARLVESLATTPDGSLSPLEARVLACIASQNWHQFWALAMVETGVPYVGGKRIPDEQLRRAADMALVVGARLADQMSGLRDA